MYDKIFKLLSSNGFEAIANTINDVKKAKSFSWDEDRYLVLGNENGRWYTMYIHVNTLQNFRIRPIESSKKYYANDNIAEDFFNITK